MSGAKVERPAAHDDGAQPQSVAAAGLLDEQARHEAPDASEPVEHNVGAGALVAAALSDDARELGADELLQ